MREGLYHSRNLAGKVVLVEASDASFPVIQPIWLGVTEVTVAGEASQILGVHLSMEKAKQFLKKYQFLFSHTNRSIND